MSELESLGETLEDSIDVATWWGVGVTKGLLYVLPAALFLGVVIGISVLAIKKPVEIIGGIK